MNKVFTLLLFLFGLFTLQAGVPEANFDHALWSSLLSKHVSPAGDVNYLGFKADQGKLKSYLALLEKNSPESDWSRNEKMAYWINAYNAYTVQLILDKNPKKSIMEINQGKAWDLKFISLNGKSMSLNNIEHDILRAKYKDARIHFAVNCASISCPKLRNSAFTAADLDRQLNEMAASFLNDSSKNKIQASSIQISKLFEWYQSDFTKEGDLISYLNKYSKTKIQANAKVSYLEYNWNLNSE